MGINALNNLSTQELRLQAGVPISSGDLLVNSDAGSVAVATPSLTIAQNNNTTTGLPAITALSSVQSGSNYGNSTARWATTSCQLGNGNIVYAYPGDGTTASTNLTILIRSITNQPAAAQIVISDTTISVFRVRRVNATSFVVVWQSGAVIKFAIYGNDGTAIKTTTTAGTSANSNNESAWNVIALTNGSFVIAYDKVTSRDCEALIYDATGTAVGSAITVEASASPSRINVLAQSGGGFVVYFRRSATTVAWKFARYNATGTLQGSLTTVYTGTQDLVGPIDDNSIIELTNGNFVVQAPDINAYPRCYVYSSTGSLITSAIDLAGNSNTYFYSGFFAGICATSGGFVATGLRSGSTLFFNLYSFSGGLIVYRRPYSITNMRSVNTTNEQAGVRIFNNGNAGFICVEQSIESACGTAFQLSAFRFGIDGTGFGAIVILEANSGTQSGSKSFFITTDGSLSIYYRLDSSVGWKYGLYATRFKSILGVAQESANVGQTLRVATAGTYPINQNFFGGGNFDQRTATVPGSRGVVTGSNATLFGMS